MTRRPITNVAASVRDRLLNRSRQTDEDFQFLLQRYAAERLLYRLRQSAHRGRFVLKGAMLFALWGGSVYRPTRDLALWRSLSRQRPQCISGRIVSKAPWKTFSSCRTK